MRYERVLAVVVSFLITIALSACNAASPPTGGAATAAPSATLGLSTTPTPKPTDSAPPSTRETTAAPLGLAQLLPATVGGAALTRKVEELETFNPDPNSDVGRLLAGVGKSAADVELASAYDATGNLAFEATAMRLLGADEASLAAAVRTAFAARDGRTIELVDMGGHEVLAVTDEGNELGTEYVLAVGDVVYAVHTPDRELAIEAFASLPGLDGADG